MNALRSPSIAKAMGKRKITIPKFTGELCAEVGDGVKG
jgi:hypothetical protein